MQSLIPQGLFETEFTQQATVLANYRQLVQVAETLNKQPERLLNMAGLLSNTALNLSLQLASSRALSRTKLYEIRRQLTLDERRLILQCAERRGEINARYNALKPLPSEFNKAERRQDRIRFSLLILAFVLLLVACTAIASFVLRS